MNTTLKKRQRKFQEHAKNVQRRDFVMHVASWMPLGFHKHGSIVSRYPDTRLQHIIRFEEFQHQTSTVKENDTIHTHGFLEQVSSFFLSKAARSLIHYTVDNENCNFSDCVHGSKNAYLCNGVFLDCENLSYCIDVRYGSNNVYGTLHCARSENIFESLFIYDSSNIYYSKGIEGSTNIYFSSNIKGCEECILCNNIENQKYCINNKQYSKSEYLTYKQKILKEKDQYLHYQRKNNENPLKNTATENSTGQGLSHTKNVTEGFIVQGVDGGKNICLSGSFLGASNHYNCFVSGGGDRLVGCMNVGNGSSHLYFSNHVPSSHNIYYSFDLISCSYCLGCIGLKNMQYCIFNKQYTKERRHQKVHEIFTQMEEEGTLGSFFPGSMNPFYFNDTAAYLIDDSFTKEEVEAAGYLRRDDNINVDIPEWMETISIQDLGNYEGFDNDGNRTIDTAILKKVIRDEQGNSYRIIKMEYDFLIKHGLPLPRKHRLERLKSHFTLKTA